jgi:hypothetical protein
MILNHKTYNNGRVDIQQPPSTSALFQLYSSNPSKPCTTLRNPTQGLWENTPLSLAFFSHQNIQIVQNGIRAGVYHRSNKQYVIAPGDCDTIQIVMRSVFLQNSMNQPTHIPEQIAQLNKLVINYFVQQVYGEAQGRIKYLADVSTLVVPLAHPVMPDNNDKQLEFTRWF